MAGLPSGTVTLLFADIEGSTHLLQRLGASYTDLLSDYRCLLRTACEAARGHEVDAPGDAYFATFPTARLALDAALAIQRALAVRPWSQGEKVHVRMALHTGAPQATAVGSCDKYGGGVPLAPGTNPTPTCLVCVVRFGRCPPS